MSVTNYEATREVLDGKEFLPCTPDLGPRSYIFIFRSEGEQGIPPLLARR